jgi:hypothetical protein
VLGVFALSTWRVVRAPARGTSATRIADVAMAEGASLVVVGWRDRRFRRGVAY